MSKKKEKVIGLLNIKGRPENLVLLEKGRYFSSSYKFFKEWMERNKDVNENLINPMERVGIYCMVFSMLDSARKTVRGKSGWIPIAAPIFQTMNLRVQKSSMSWKNRFIPILPLP